MSTNSQASGTTLLDEQASGPNTRPASLHCEFTFAGDLDSVTAAREQLMEIVREQGCDEPEEYDLTVALQEALINAALHGCGNHGTKCITCSLEMDPASVCVVIRDPGPGFDFQTAADPDRFPATTLTHGRGIALMRSLVDEVTFARGGTEVRLFKRMRWHPRLSEQP